MAIATPLAGAVGDAPVGMPGDPPPDVMVGAVHRRQRPGPVLMATAAAILTAGALIAGVRAATPLDSSSLGSGAARTGQDLRSTCAARPDDPLCVRPITRQPGGIGALSTGVSSSVGGTLAATVPGVTAGYYAPAPTATPDAPGRMILSGPDAPDPFVLVTGGHYFLYTSEGNAPGLNVPLREGTELGEWGPVRDALPRLPPWAVPGFTWAPDVRQVAGGWALYFTAIVRGSQPPVECIGAAFGPGPTGPFTAQPAPFVCQLDHRGSIDPRTFVDADGTLWLDWKSDDNADPDVPGPDQGGVTGIWAQRLSPDGRTLLGPRAELYRPDLPWEGTIAEAPQLVLVQGAYWLFFSANWFNSVHYAIGIARCVGPAGPCVDARSTPLLGSNAQGTGPGEPSVFRDATGVWLAYNPWRSDVPGATPPRPVAVVRLGFGVSGPYLATG